MSSLTDEQRRRIEENRRKALERRAAAGNNATVTQPRQFSTNNQNFQKGVNNGGGVSSSNLQKTAGSFYTMPTAHEGNSVSTGLKSHGNEAKVLRPSEPFLRAPSAPPSSIYPANTVILHIDELNIMLAARYNSVRFLNYRLLQNPILWRRLLLEKLLVELVSWWPETDSWWR